MERVSSNAMVRSFAGALVGVVIAATGLDGQAVEPLIEAPWLLQHIDDPGIVLLHVGGSGGFERSHLPGARQLSLGALAWDGEEGWRVEFRSPAETTESLRALGVMQDSRVILYGPRMTSVARAWVTFDWLGLENQAFVLNGGMPAWRAAGGAFEDGVARSDFQAGNLAVSSTRTDFRVSADWIHERLDDPALVLLDARPDDEYTGADGGMGGMANPGHIPGATQLYWEDLMSPDNPTQFRPFAEMAKILSDHGAGPDKLHVSYCMIGLRASVDFMAARMMGYEVRFYDGSWHDWGTRDDLPAETGRDQR